MKLVGRPEKATDGEREKLDFVKTWILEIPPLEQWGSVAFRERCLLANQKCIGFDLIRIRLKKLEKTLGKYTLFLLSFVDFSSFGFLSL